MIPLSLLLYLISDSSVPTEIIAISSGTFSNFERVPVSSTSISTTTRRPEGDASDKLISTIVSSKLTHCFRPTHPRRRFRHVLRLFLMTLNKTFFVAVELPGVSSGSSNASCVVNQRNRASFSESRRGDVRFSGPPRSLRLFIRYISFTAAGPPAHHPYETPSCNDPVHISSTIFSTATAPPLGSGAVTPSQQIFFSSSSPRWGTPEIPNGANSDGARTRGCMCDPRLQTRSAHFRGCN